MPWRVTFDVRGRWDDQAATEVFDQDEIVLGRDERRAHLVLRSSNVSRRHCAFRVIEGGTVWIVDLESTNGIHVNGRQVRDQEFKVGDELMTGEHVIRLVAPPEWLEPLPAFDLLAHPESKGTAVERVSVVLSLARGDLVVRYTFEGATERLEVPRSRLDPERLWEHTCAELFVAAPNGDPYVEWNFSPTGQSARFAFSGYRQRVGHQVADAPVRVEQDAKTLVLITRGRFVPDPTARIGLTAITRDVDGTQSLWALAHPTDRPDFHHRDGFIAALESPGRWSLPPP